MNDRPNYLCARCNRPIDGEPATFGGLFHHPGCVMPSREFTEREKEQIRLVLLQTLHDLGARLQAPDSHVGDTIRAELDGAPNDKGGV